MTQLPPSEPSNLPPVRRPRWRSVLLPTGVVLLGLVGAGIWYGRKFLNEEFSPLVARELSKTLNRPVQVGKVQRVSPTGIRLGASSIPPTATDADRVNLEAIDIGFNPWQALVTRRVNLDITLVRPDVYLDQDNDGAWITTEIAQQEQKDSPFEVIPRIRVESGKVVLAPKPPVFRAPGVSGRPLITLGSIDATVNILDKNQRITYEMAGQAGQGGTFQLEGETRLPAQDTTLQIKADKLSAAEFSPLLLAPVAITQGRISGDVGVEYELAKGIPSLSGTANFDQISLVIEGIPQPFSQASGNVRFQDTQVELERVRSRYGDVPFQANGNVDLKQGYNIAATVDRVKVPTALNTLKLELPIPITGEVSADLKLTGQLDKPVLAGIVRNTDVIRVDQVDLSQVNAAFALDTGAQALTFSRVQATPAAGGQVTGSGKLTLVETPQLTFNAQAVAVPADPIARTYAGGNPLPVQIGAVNAQAQVTGAVDNLKTLIRWQAPSGTYPGSGTIDIAGTNITLRDTVLAVEGGQVNVQANAANGRWQADLAAVGVSLSRFVPTLSERINAEATLTGSLDSFQPETIQGTGQARLAIAQGGVQVDAQARDGRWQVQIDGNQVPLDRLVANLPAAVNTASGSATLSGSLASLRPEDVTGSGQAVINVDGSPVNLQAQARAGRWQAQLSGRQVPLAGLLPNLPDAVGTATAEANLAGSLADLSPGSIVGSGRAVVAVEDGTLNVQAQARNGRWQAKVNGDRIPVSKVITTLPNAVGQASGSADLTGSLVNLSPTSIAGTARATVAVDQGSVDVNAQATQGRWQATVKAAQVPLRPFSPELKGTLDGNFLASGTLASFSPAAIRVEGVAKASEGISVVQGPLAAQFQWNGQRILLSELVAPGLRASGTIAARLEGTPTLGPFDLTVQLNDYDVAALAAVVPNNVVIPTGRVDFDGRVRGTLTNPQVNGTVALRQLKVNDVAFEPLQGTLQVQNGVKVDLAGPNDRLNLALDSNYQPLTFEVRTRDLLAKGFTRGNQLQAELKNVPVAVARVPGLTPALPASGVISGKATVDLETFSAVGDLTIDRPIIGGYRAQQLVTSFRFANGVVTLNKTQLARGNSLFQVQGSANLRGSDPSFNGKLEIVRGRLQDALELLQYFEIEDLGRGAELPTFPGRAADLTITPVDVTSTPVISQLRRLAEIEVLQQQLKTDREASLIPELRELKGDFVGTVNLEGSLKRGVTVDFDLQGQDWQWGRFQAKQVIVAGGFRDGVLNVLPIQFRSDEASITLRGQVAVEKQGVPLQIEVRNFPIEQFAELFPDALAVEGLLNATVTLAGSLAKPRATGVFSLANAVLNNTEVQAIRGSFEYTEKAQLEFGSRILITASEPLVVEGKIPYSIPFSAVFPETDQIELTINVKDQGLAVLNLFTDQVAWIEGKGRVNIAVGGTLKQPIVSGLAQVENATLQARALPDPLTSVEGRIEFKQSLLDVRNLTGQYGQGSLSGKGELPIFTPSATTESLVANPLAVALENIKIQLKGIYRGGVSGNLQIGRSLLQPLISGEILLQNGEVQLSDPPAPDATVASPGQLAADSPIEFNNLKLTLGNNVQVTRQPILAFVAAGDLLISGSLSNPQPQGVINLKSGIVNLFTTQFALQRGYPQKAEFTPAQGLDPNLDVRLITSVPEVGNVRQPSTLLSSEIIDAPATASSLGSLQTVRIRARVLGSASGFSDALELTSSPGRSREEILGLLGAGFVNTLGRGDTALGIANLAGSALLTNVQSVIGNALGLSEFRLFPTFVSSDAARDSRSTNSTFALAAEVGIDITESLSISALSLLTASQPTQFGLRYRLNDQILLRGSTDFSGDNRASIEYELRF